MRPRSGAQRPTSKKYHPGTETGNASTLAPNGISQITDISAQRTQRRDQI
jgi:hypothetical protein